MTDIKFDCEIAGQKRSYVLKQEDVAIQRACEIEYHKAYVQSMKDGLIPRASLEQLMREKEIWTETHATKLSQLQDELNILVLKLETNKDLNSGLELAKKISLLRSHIIMLLDARSSVFQSSCEFIADQIRREAYIAHATYTEAGERVYKNYNDFVAQRDGPIASAAMNALIRFISETFQATIDSLPENKVLNQVINETPLVPVPEIKSELVNENPKPTKIRKTKSRN